MLTKGTSFDRSGATVIDVNSGVEPNRAIYFYRVNTADESCITEFCVANHCGPQSVLTYPPRFTPDQFASYVDRYEGADAHDRKQGDIMVEWESYEEGELLVFKAPSQDHAGQPIRWQYDPRLQRGEMANKQDMDRFILGGRKSLVVQGLKADLVSLQPHI